MPLEAVPDKKPADVAGALEVLLWLIICTLLPAAPAVWIAAWRWAL